MTPRQVETAAVALVGAVAVGTLGYRLGAGEPVAAACAAALAVLLTAVPSALHLATAMPPLVAVSRAVRLGILLPDAAVARRVDTVVLAGSDTLVGPALEVHDVRPADGVSPGDALRLAGAVAQESDRPLDRAIAAASPRLPGVAEFDAVEDLGVRGVVAEVIAGGDGDHKVFAHAVLVGSVELLAAHDIVLPAELADAPADAAATGRIPVAVAWDGVARAVLVVGHAVAPAHLEAASELRRLGLRPVLLAAGPAPAAQAVAGRAGLDPDAVIAEVAPGDEAGIVQRLRAAGARVAVVADGTHGSALAAADVAVRTGPLPQPARSGGRAGSAAGDLPAAVDAIRTARRADAVARANLGCVLACLAAAVPAGATGLLDPVLAGSASAAVVLVVVANSLRLQRAGTTGG